MLSDMQTGTVQVSGTLDASAPTAGDGGFIDTSAAHLEIGATAHIVSNALNGKAGEWLIDPLNVTIGTSGSTTGGIFTGGVWTPTASGSFIHTGTIVGALDAGTSVTITTVNAGFAEAGDINVNASIVQTGATPTTLTLLAENNINFAANAGISSTNVAPTALNVVLRADADANSAGTVTFAGTNTFSLAGGRVDLYYNPVSYADAATKSDALTNPYSAVFGATPFTAWMLVNDVGLATGGTLGLQAMSTNLSGNYALGTNIDATATVTWNPDGQGGFFGFAPVGISTAGFNGKFDGMGSNINGLYINRPAQDYVGLFGYTFGVGTTIISNVNLTNANITGGSLYTGAIAGYSTATIQNSSVSGAVNGTSYVGGLVGNNFTGGNVDNSISSATVTAASGVRVGGLVGSTSNGNITNSSATGAVIGFGDVGGLIGYNSNSTWVYNCHASGNVTGGAAGSAGGLIGMNWSYTLTELSSASGIVSGTAQVGGLVGYNYYATLTGNFATGSVNGDTNIGGLAGYSYFSTLTDNYATGNVDGLTNIGGLAGQNFYTTISGTTQGATYAIGTVTGVQYVGGIAGYNQWGASASINNASIVNPAGTLAASVIGQTSVGGIAGYNYASITNSYVSGGSVSGGNNVGGLIGVNWAVSGSISNNHVSGGNISGTRNVGGLIGVNYGSSISNNYVDGGSITGTVQVGGLIALNNGTYTNSQYNINGVSINGSNMVTQGGLYAGQYATWFAGGALTPLVITNYLTQNGTTFNYQIGSVLDMQNMLAFADNPAYNFELTASLDLSAAPNLWVPYLAGNFVGTPGLTISNVSVNVPNAGVGLFGATTGVISDLGVSNVFIQGASGVGGLVGNNFGSIVNSYVESGVVSTSVHDVGGLVGLNNGAVTNSHFNIDAVTTNAGNNVTFAGLYATQYNDWFNGGTLTPLSIGNYASLVLQGDGSYGINTVQGMKDMLAFADDPTVFNFSLTGNVDLTPLPGFYVPALNGSFNGNNFIVSNLSLNLPNSDVGLFGVSYANNLIGNIQLANANVSGFDYVGGLVGFNRANITGASVSGASTINASGNFVGGLVGQNSGLTSLGVFLGTGGAIGSSYVDGGTISSPNGMSVGGLVGVNKNGHIDSSYVSNTNVTGSSEVGGLVGNNSGSITNWGSNGQLIAQVSNSYVTNGTVTGTGNALSLGIGGLVGYNRGGGISGSYVLNPTVNGGVASQVGGLVGGNAGGVNSTYITSSTLTSNFGVISNSYVSGGTVSSLGNEVGGLVGKNYGGLIDFSYVDSLNVTGVSNVGGLVGWDSGEGSGCCTALQMGVISNSYVSNTQVTGWSHVGGLAGMVGVGTDTYLGISWTSGPVSDDSIVNSYVDGGTVSSVVTGTGSVGSISGVGGLVGYNFGGNISNSYVANGTVVSGGTAFAVGGLVGDNNGTSLIWLTSQGVWVPSARISSSYVDIGVVSGVSSVGGLVGINSGSISGSYAITGTIAGTGVGGLVGFDNGSVSNSFWDTEASGIGVYASGGAGAPTNVNGLLTSETHSFIITEAALGVAGLMANTGGTTGMTWRIYEGQTAPLLMSYLTPLTVSVAGSRTYNALTDVSSLVTYSQTLNANLLGTAVADTASPNVGTYSVTPSGHYSNQMGYDITFASGSVTINPAGLTLLDVTASDASKVYGSTLNFAGTEFAPVGLMGGDVISSVTLTSAGATATANAGSYAIVPSNAMFSVGSASNYDITYINGILTVTPKAVSISGSSAVDRAYNGTTSATISAGSLIGLVGSETLSVNATGTFADKNVGTAITVQATYSLANGTGLASNYTLTTTSEVLAADITPAVLTVLAVSENKILGTPDPLLRYIVTGYYDPVSTILEGEPVRDAGEVIGNYAILQGSLFVMSSNYTMDFVPGSFSILAPTVVQEITQNTVDAGSGTTPTTDEEEEKKKAEQLAQEESLAQQETNKLAEQLPICR
ncbi:MAG: hypothetical protein KKA63_00055 [Gammaproteobacteria bacterium]|nr:hypothetical protein [Gammaproteobacteria bacterium]